MMDYLITAGDALSQLANAVFFNSGNANESLSGRAYANRNRSVFWLRMYWFINALFFWQHDHCQEAFLKDLERAAKILGYVHTN